MLINEMTHKALLCRLETVEKGFITEGVYQKGIIDNSMFVGEITDLITTLRCVLNIDLNKFNS